MMISIDTDVTVPESQGGFTTQSACITYALSTILYDLITGLGQRLWGL